MTVSAAKYPTGDEGNTGEFTYTGGASLWASLADADDATFVTGVKNAGGYCTCSFTAFAIASTAIIDKLSITFRHRSAATTYANTGCAYIKVGTTYSAGAMVAPNGSAGAIKETTQDWTLNPVTSAAWTYDEINGTDATTAHRLVAFGVGGDDFNADVNFYQVYATVTYHTATAVTSSVLLGNKITASRARTTARTATALIANKIIASRARTTVRAATVLIANAVSASYEYLSGSIPYVESATVIFGNLVSASRSITFARTATTLFGNLISAGRAVTRTRKCGERITRNV